MPRINPANTATADNATVALLGAVKKKLGTVPSIIATMANRCDYRSVSRAAG